MAGLCLTNVPAILLENVRYETNFETMRRSINIDRYH